MCVGVVEGLPVGMVLGWDMPVLGEPFNLYCVLPSTDTGKSQGWFATPARLIV